MFWVHSITRSSNEDDFVVQEFEALFLRLFEETLDGENFTVDVMVGV